MELYPSNNMVIFHDRDDLILSCSSVIVEKAVMKRAPVCRACLYTLAVVLQEQP